jgi:hypothetical protein
MKSLKIFGKSIMAIVAIEYLIIICDLIWKYFGKQSGYYLYLIPFFFFGAFLLLPAILLVILFMPWRKEWLKLRFQLAMSFFLYLAFIWYVLYNYGE